MKRPRLRERVDFEEETITPNGGGGVAARGWAADPARTGVAAEILSAAPPAEQLEGGGRRPVERFKVTVRYRTDLSAAMRIRWGARVLQFEGFGDPLGTRQWLTGYATAGEPT